MRKRKIFSGILLVFLALLMGTISLTCFTATAAGEVIELKLSHWIPAETEFSKTIFQPVVDYINKNGGGKIHCTQYGGGALGGPNEQYEMVKEGIADIAYLVPPFEPGVWPLSEMMGMPITFPKNVVGAEAALATYERVFKDEYTDVKCFGVYRTGDLYINLRNKKVATLEDFQGLRIRSAGGFCTIGLKTLGAAPISMPPPDIYLSMERGVLDGASMTYSFMETYKMAEVTKHTLEFGLGTGVCAFIMNLNTWKKLSPDLQQVVEKACQLGTKLNYEYPDNITPRSKAAMLKTGEINVLTPTQMKRWYDTLRPAIHKVAADLDAKGKKGTQTLDVFREECKKRGFDFPY